ncbi:hypothetical protein RSOLAG22IIIB_02498 [Rhizoctonia solani]|uniref:Uncharacterized protein n=1 Tax=Rhizoctonia solani TaxID=456999 RepID=A0A0K6GFW3_9AGAM|nr:hypothetical protein RSOLAG22IIIB_02498 [Rhizoctonia solani]
MKRRHESTFESVPRSPYEGTENVPRRIFKKRRTIDNDNWDGLGGRRSLRDINNLSVHPVSIPHDEKTTSEITHSKVHPGSVINSVKQTTPTTSNIHTSELNTPLHGPRSEHQSTSTNARPLAVSVPGQRVSVSEPAPSLDVGASESRSVPSVPRFASHDKPVRVTQSRIPQQTHSSNKRLDLDSDQEDEDSDSDEESDDNGLGTEDPVDSDEKQRVESNYSEMNK